VLVRYARVTTRDQSPARQLDALKAADCERIVEETASGAKRERPELLAVLTYMRAGDTQVVWKLDRLARSTRQLIEAKITEDDGTARDKITRVQHLAA
jgi:DNA invertase Pin-like site-specific DNA recombinase